LCPTKNFGSTLSKEKIRPISGFRLDFREREREVMDYGGKIGGSERGGPCGACKFLRRKCVKGCIFAPYFDSDQGTAHFAAVHKVFGASNASKLLMRIPAHKRLDAVVTLCYEALARARDPVYGCVGHLFALQQQVHLTHFISPFHFSLLHSTHLFIPLISFLSAHHNTF